MVCRIVRGNIDDGESPDLWEDVIPESSDYLSSAVAVKVLLGPVVSPPGILVLNHTYTN